MIYDIVFGMIAIWCVYDYHIMSQTYDIVQFMSMTYLYNIQVSIMMCIPCMSVNVLCEAWPLTYTCMYEW